MTEATVSKKSAIIIFVLAAILVTWIDLWSKQAVHEFLEVETIETSDGKPRIVDPRKYFVVIKKDDAARMATRDHEIIFSSP